MSEVPIYEYQILNPDGTVRDVFEIEQRMSDASLSNHPDTGEPVRRILSSTFAHTSSGRSQCKNVNCGFSNREGGCGNCNWD